jgi:hypothetical protein
VTGLQRANYHIPSITYYSQDRPGQPSERQIRLRLRNRWKALSTPEAAASLALVPIREAAKRPEATKFIAPLCRDCRNVLSSSSQHNNNRPFDCGPSTTISCFFRSSRPFFRKKPSSRDTKKLENPIKPQFRDRISRPPQASTSPSLELYTSRAHVALPFYFFRTSSRLQFCTVLLQGHTSCLPHSHFKDILT